MLSSLEVGTKREGNSSQPFAIDQHISLLFISISDQWSLHAGTHVCAELNFRKKVNYNAKFSLSTKIAINCQFLTILVVCTNKIVES